MNKKVKIKIVGGDVGDKNMEYDPAVTDTDEYQAVQKEVMKRIERSYWFMDDSTGLKADPYPSKENGYALPLTEGPLILLAPVSGG